MAKSIRLGNALVGCCLMLGVANVAQAKTTANYIQNGLVACWDGWENSGAGQHQDAPTAWIDVVGNRSLALDERDFFTGCEVTLTNVVRETEEDLFDEAGDVTLEVNGRPLAPCNADYAPVVGIPNFAGFGWSNFKGGIVAYYPHSAANIEWHRKTYTSGYTYANDIAAAGVSQTYTSLLGVGSSAAYVNGVSSAYSGASDWHGSARGTGFQAQVGTTSGSGSVVRNIRIYNRKLTVEEIAINAAVDKARFVDGDLVGEGIPGVFVKGEPENVTDGALPAYGCITKHDGDAVELTAPDYVVVSDSERIYCAGWKLYDESSDKLLAESTDETRLTCAFDYKIPVRLVWQWDWRYPVTVTADAGLTVTPATAWGSAAFPAEFTVDGADFPLWSGEGLESEPHAKTALFAPTAATAAAVAVAAVRTPSDVTGLMAAIASSEDGDVVIVPDGTNSFAEVTAEQMAGGLALTKAVLVTSRSGDPTDVTVDLGGTGYGFTLKAPGARLRGITFISSAAMTDSADLTLPRFANVIAGTLDGCVFTDIVFGGTKAKGSHPVSLAADGVIENCRFENLSCTAENLTRGAVYATGGLISKTTFRSCNTRPAPVVATGAALVTVEDCSFTGISSTSTALGANYGAFSCAKGPDTTEFVARRTVVANNSVPGSAGVVYFDTSNDSSKEIHFEDCVFTNNVAAGDSGVLGGKYRPDFVCDRCVIADNVGASYGVIAAWGYTWQTFRNCLIRGNTGKAVAGVTFTANPQKYHRWKFENCTVTGNKTTSGSCPGLGIAGCGQASDTWVKNCIVYGNIGKDGDTQLGVDASKVFSSCFPEAADDDANGNTNEDPQLNADGTLKYSSPCIDAGLNLVDTAGTTDLVGTARPQNVKGTEVPLWDMGCFEMPPNTATLEVSILIDRTVGTTAVTATAQASGTDLSGLVYDWTVTRTTPTGSTVTEYKGRTEPELALTDLAPGSYSFAVKVTNGSGDETPLTTCENTFSAKTPVCYVSKTGSATWPYDEPAKATLVLADALANAAARVEIDAGEYTAAEMGTMTDPASGNAFMMVVGEPVEVVGAGPGRTKFLMDGETAAICVVNANAVVGGFTVSGAGRTDAAFSGSSVSVAQGVVSNVVVRDSTVWGSAVYVGMGAAFKAGLVTNLTYRTGVTSAYPVGLSGGTLEDVVIAGNSVWDGGGIRLLQTAIDGVRATIRRVKVVGNTIARTTPYTGHPVACGIVASQRVDVYDSEFTDNEGGAVICAHANNDCVPNLTLTNCRIVGNRISDCDGALVAASHQPATVVNTLIADNVGGRGVFVGSGSSGSSFRNCTVSGNVAANAVNAGIVATTGNYKLTLVNCVFWGNRGNGGEGSADFELTVPAGTVEPSVTYCCWPEATRENGNTPDDPKLRTVKRYRYYPSPTGSCYETGDATGWTDADVDLAGNPRLRGEKVDIGCYQAVPLPGFMLRLK